MSIEILAPVGNREKLEAAILAGANAVYLAGKEFGARSYAANFSNKEISEAIEYCHIRDVKVYITVNTLIKDCEIDEILEYINFLYISDVDALIIQDIGLFSLVYKIFPDLDLHASTQMTAHSIEDVKFLEEIGFARVILSREVSIDEIRKIKEESNVELEVFVHGALCVSYSGQCLMSSFIGARSGNRGKCAQPCRKKYKLIDTNTKDVVDKGHLLSTKDLSTIKYIDELKDLGISSLKIEGRMKSKEYVYTVVKAYKDSLVGNDLKKVFNRKFTKGFLFNEEVENFVTKETPNNKGYLMGTILNVDNNFIQVKLNTSIVLQDEIQIRRDGTSVGTRIEIIYYNNRKVKNANKGSIVKIKFTKAAYKGEKLYKTFDVEYMKDVDLALNDKTKEIGIDIDLDLKIDKKPIIKVTDSRGNIAEATVDFLIQKAKNKPLSEKRVEKALNKLGDTPYTINNINIKGDKNIFIPISKINEIRRNVIEKLDKLRVKIYDREEKDLQLPAVNNKRKGNKELSVKVSNVEQLREALKFDIDYLYYSDIETFKEACEIAKDRKIVLSLNTITSSNEYENISDKAKMVDEVLASTVGQINILDNKKIYGDMNLNIFNYYSAKFYENIGINHICFSPELNLDEMNVISRKIDLKTEAIIYGYIPVMSTKYNFINKDDEYVLNDAFSENYPMRYINKNLLEIYNSRCVFMMENYNDLLNSNLDILRLDFTIEKPEKVNEIIYGFTKLMKKDIDKEYMSLIEKYKSGTSKAHFFRGVE